jgi:hypothetical protein
LAGQPPYEEIAMKFQASVVFELKADSIGEAGQRLNDLLNLAEDEHDMAAKSVELRTPPVDVSTGPPVILPPVTTYERRPEPQAGGLSAVSPLGPGANSAR